MSRALLAVLALAGAACWKTKTKDAPAASSDARGDVAAADAATARTGMKSESKLGSMSARELIRQAGLCGNVYRCPPLDELARRAEGADHAAVRAAAVETILDPGVPYGSHWSRAARYALRDWMNAQASGLSAGEREAVLAELRRIFDEADPKYHGLVYDYFEKLIPYPKIVDFLVDEIKNPARSDEDVRLAATLLGPYQKDMVLATSWVRSGDFRLVRAAARMMRYIDHAENRTIEEYKALLLELAATKGLPVDIAWDVLEPIDICDDPRLQPGLDALKQHPNANFAAKAAAVKLGDGK